MILFDKLARSSIFYDHKMHLSIAFQLAFSKYRFFANAWEIMGL